jgi:integrase/recombinase XerD
MVTADQGGLAAEVTGLRLLGANVGGPPAWAQACREYLESLELLRYSDHTVEWYRFLLGPIGRYLESVEGITDPSAVGERHVLAFLRIVGTEGFEGRRPVGARRLNHYREALYRFYLWLHQQGCASHNPAERVAKVREPKRLIQTFTETQVAALLQQPDRSRFVGLRDYCFFLTLLDTGMRLSEALSLQVESLDLDEMWVNVIGKGNKERRVAMSPRLLVELKPYLRKRDAAVAAVGVPDSPWVFPNDIGKRLCSKAMQKHLKAYGEQAEVKRVRVSPHTFRHTFAVNFVRNGGDPFTLQKILGHESLETTRRYCELAEEDVLRRHRELTPLRTMDLNLSSSKRIPRAPMKDW